MTRDHSTPRHPTPGPKTPVHRSTSRPAKTSEQKIDRQVEDSFPASDPPSYSGGNHIVGAPDNGGKRRKGPSKH